MHRSSAIAFSAIACFLGGIASADAAVMVLGSSKGHACYLAARTGIDIQAGLKLCDEALGDGGMVAKDVAATHVNRGVLLNLSGRFEEAYNDFNRGIRFNPELGDGYLNRGVALTRMNRLDEALADVQHGISLGVSQPEIGFFDRAIVFERLGRFTEAYYDYKRTLEVAPGYEPATEALKHFVVTRKPAARPAASGGT